MYGLLLFFHLTGLSIWLGSLVAVIVMLTMMKKHIASPEIGQLAQKTVKIFNFLTHPSSFVVLISGVLLIVDMGLIRSAKPFWMHYMEEVGGMFILLFIVLLSILGKKLVVKLTAGDQLDIRSGMARYLSGMMVSVVCVLSVVFIVAVKL
ncbi:hypothetical protein EYB31_08155 [Paenibacillus thalictri]|uniref:DUF2269 family protein n=2 Tax=Paenibacillus thalictri TaxID=2527873 RepID=A0A4Q9DWJ9_9BACL|nr:hypothetical protein EYB31_08155 [Paenibacillus thalictri]